MRPIYIVFMSDIIVVSSLYQNQFRFMLVRHHSLHLTGISLVTLYQHLKQTFVLTSEDDMCNISLTSGETVLRSTYVMGDRSGDGNNARIFSHTISEVFQS